MRSNLAFYVQPSFCCWSCLSARWLEVAGDSESKSGIERLKENKIQGRERERKEKKKIT